LFALGVAAPLAVTLTHGNLDGRLFGACIALALTSLYAGAVSWLLGLARTASDRRWDWFVAVLALGPAAALLYGLRRTSAIAAV
jgi:hypothetical protein